MLRGADWLVRQQVSSGAIIGDSRADEVPRARDRYTHVLSTLALARVITDVEGGVAYAEALASAVDYLLAEQTTSGGWTYREADTAPLTGLGALTLLRADRFLGDVPPDAIARAVARLDAMTENDGRTGYMKPGYGSSREPGANERWPTDETELLTALSILAHVASGVSVEKPKLEKGLGLIDAVRESRVDRRDDELTRDTLFLFFGGLAIEHAERRTRDSWRKLWVKELADSRFKGGHADGSWDPQLDPWGLSYGRVGMTAVSMLALDLAAPRAPLIAYLPGSFVTVPAAGPRT